MSNAINVEYKLLFNDKLVVYTCIKLRSLKYSKRIACILKEFEYPFTSISLSVS